MGSNVYICNLNEDEKRLAELNLNETDESRVERIKDIRDWIKANPEIVSRTDDFFILRFLRACKFNVEKAKCKIRNYHQQKTNCPEWYTNRDPLSSEMQEMLDLGVFLPLRKLDHEGRLVIILRVCIHDPKKHSISVLLKTCLAILELAIRDNEAVTLNGVVAVIDTEGALFAHAMQLQPHIIKRLVHAWQGCYPIRIRAIDFINAPFHVNIVLNIFKTFMTQKMKSRLFIHHCGNKAICKKLPIDILPREYGGTDDTVNELKDFWKKQVEENKDWLIDDEQYKVVDL